MRIAEHLSSQTLARAQPEQTPLSVYVHLPWCVRKCPYCDFNSHRAPSHMPENQYLQALLADWQFSARGEKRPIQSVFFGGGTPSLFSASAFESILKALDRHPGLASDCEITLEANPGTREYTNFHDLRAAGINRVSLGVQSLDADCLSALGRVHGPDEALAAIADVKKAGITELNCDLMFGLPDQSLASGLRDIELLLAQQPGHISYYQLTLESGTPFYRFPPSLPDDDLITDLFEAGCQRLQEAGYRQYEVSAWGQTHVCRHNDNYWRFGDYLAIGAGAHSKQTLNDGTITRTARLKWPTGYMRTAGTAQAIAQQRSLSLEEACFETLLNGLRRRDGITRQDYEQRTGLNWRELLRLLALPLQQGLLETEGEDRKSVV